MNNENVDSPLIFSTIPCVIKNALQGAYFLHFILHSPSLGEIGGAGDNLESPMLRGVRLGIILNFRCYVVWGLTYIKSVTPTGENMLQKNLSNVLKSKKDTAGFHYI